MMSSTCHEDRTKKKNLSPLQELKVWPSVQRSYTLTTELWKTRGELGHIQGSCVLCTARMSNVEIVMCVISKEWWLILSSLKKWEVTYQHVTSTGQRNRNWTYDLSHTGQMLYPLSYEGLVVSLAIYIMYKVMFMLKIMLICDKPLLSDQPPLHVSVHLTVPQGLPA